jgi:hypothetical protein
MDANKPGHSKPGPLWDECRQVVGCAFEVLNELGHGCTRSPMRTPWWWSSDTEASRSPSRLVFQCSIRVQVSEYVPDLIAFDQLIIDAKVIERITDHERGQMLNHLRIARLQAGPILNFRRAKLEWERVILSSHS